MRVKFTRNYSKAVITTLFSRSSRSWSRLWVMCFIEVLIHTSCSLCVAQERHILFSQKWQNLLELEVVDTQNIWITGVGGLILSSSDGGFKWHTHEVNARYEWFSGVFFHNPQQGYIVGCDGTILRTSDGGGSWSSTKISNAHFTDITFITHKIGVACGVNGSIFRTVDGGETWQQVESPTSHLINRLWSISPNLIWGAGGGGSIIYSTNSGKQWLLAHADSTEMFYDICFINENMGWVCGQNGTVLYSEDGGKRWINRSIDTKQEFCAISFMDQIHGLVAGGAVNQHSLLYITRDGGKNWREIEDEDQKWWKSCRCLSPQSCYLAGNDMLIKLVINDLENE